MSQIGQEPSMEDILQSIRRTLSKEEQGKDSDQPNKPHFNDKDQFSDHWDVLDLRKDDEVVILEDHIKNTQKRKENSSSLQSSQDNQLSPASVEELAVRKVKDEPVENVEKNITAFSQEKSDANSQEKSNANSQEKSNANSQEKSDADSQEKSDADSVISENVKTDSLDHLSELTALFSRKKNLAMGSDAHLTLDAVVRELLRPLLKEWLDENLSEIVDRTVKREIKNLVNQAEDF